MYAKIELIFLCMFFSTVCSGEKIAVFIVGPGRCGSSCLAGTLQIMGLELGNNLKGATVNNLKGKFEDLATIEFHQKIFCTACDFYNPDLINWQNHPDRDKYIALTEIHLKKHFGRYDVFGIKNPEISTRLPVYLKAAKNLGYIPKVIIAIRKPHEIAASLKKISAFSMERCYLNIAVYLTSCLWAFDECEVMTVFYEDLLYETEKTVNRLCQFIPGLKTFDQVRDSLGNFLDLNLKHN